MSTSTWNWALSPSATSLVVTEPNRAAGAARLGGQLDRFTLQGFGGLLGVLLFHGRVVPGGLFFIFQIVHGWASASMASPRGSRKLRAYPSDTLTSWPFCPGP